MPPNFYNVAIQNFRKRLRQNVNTDSRHLGDIVFQA